MKGDNMRIPSLLVAALAAITISSSHAQKEPYNGSAVQLAGFASAYERGRASGGAVAPSDLEDVGFFKGFVQGVFVTLRYPCRSSGLISMDQVEAVVAKYICENLERWGMQARDLVIEATDRVWGCKNEPPKNSR
jgi:hypothetical protein